MKNQNPKKRRHHTGQLSIFIILLFPVLFVLFAISLNITLVVHDKINLQNSVDIATYYGAMKQAEMLNAIAHVNYQIRQSWKLLSWRYRVLGSVSLTNNLSLTSIPQDIEKEHYLPAFKNRTRPGPYFFCVAHKDWGGFINKEKEKFVFHDSSKDMLCKEMGETINAPTIPAVTGTLGSLFGTLKQIRDAGIRVTEQLTQNCKIYGYNSWFLGAWSFWHFRLDQSARQHIIYQLAKAMSGNGPKIGSPPHDHGTDLDGNSIALGVKKTFEKNLTFINKEAFTRDPSALKQFNSLQNENPKWLREIPIRLLGLYAKLDGGAGNCQKKLAWLNKPPSYVANSPSVQILKRKVFDEVGSPWHSCGTSICKPSAGLYKYRKIMVFYSVKAELDYKNQIFLPFGSGKVKLKAKAFAKPFGGTIGPNPNPETPTGRDLLLPHEDHDSSGNFRVVDTKLTPNYSRYPGDPYGLRSSYVHYYWANHIKKSAKNTKNVLNYSKYKYPDDRDPLARDDTLPPGTSLLARKWELAAVSPDLFDVTYFTILPYYMHTYFPKIKNLLSNTSAFNSLRGDLGTFKDATGGFLGPSVLNQIGGHPKINSEWDLIHSPPHLSTPPPPATPNQNKPWYKITDLKLLLTGWNPPKQKYKPKPNYGNIQHQQTNFGNCNMWVHDSNSGVNLSDGTTIGRIATGCIYGGRMGYSVKMISAKIVKGLTGGNDKMENNLSGLDWLNEED